MVLEYMCHGDLLGFLRASRGHHGLYTVFPGKREQLPSLNLTSRDIINIATKISSGMMFLEKKKVPSTAFGAMYALFIFISIFPTGSAWITVCFQCSCGNQPGY